MAKYWVDVTSFSDLQELIPVDQTTINLEPVIPSPGVLERTLLWWEARWFTPFVVAGGNRTPLNWDFEMLAVENDTGEAPPPGPADLVMRGLITAQGPGTTFPRSSDATDVFQAWLGSSGATPMESASKRAAVGYSGGLLMQIRFKTSMELENPEAFWWDGPWSLYFKVAMLINDPSL